MTATERGLHPSSRPMPIERNLEVGGSRIRVAGSSAHFPPFCCSGRLDRHTSRESVLPSKYRWQVCFLEPATLAIRTPSSPRPREFPHILPATGKAYWE